MKARFEGDDGGRRLVDALCEQRLVEYNRVYAERLAGVGTLVAFSDGDIVIRQDAPDNHVYFILSGEVGVLVNERQVARRTARDSVGEMALIDPSAPRSATVRAMGAVVSLRVDEASLMRLLEEFPAMWRPIARVVSDRLRQRSHLLRMPNARPRLFLGSSVESLHVARQIQVELKHDAVDAEVWTNGIFGASSVTLDALAVKVAESDFAAFVFSGDDHVASRGKESDAPRDNVIFELGLFLGVLTRERTFFVKEHRAEIKIPTDLLGITPMTYIAGANLSAQLGPACQELREIIRRLGPR